MSHERHEAAERYESAREWFFGVGELDEVPQTPEEGEAYGIAYEGSYTDSTQIVKGVLRLHETEYAVIVDTKDTDHTEYTICGAGLSDREKGEVIKERDDGRRKIGEFEYAFRLGEEDD